MMMMRISGKSIVSPFGCAGADCSASAPHIRDINPSITPHITFVAPFLLRNQAAMAGISRKQSSKILPALRPSQLDCLAEARLKPGAETFKVPKTNSLPNSAHHVKVKVDVVVGRQNRRQALPRGK